MENRNLGISSVKGVSSNKGFPKQQSCIHELFEAQVKRTPETVALVFEDQQLTYAELNARANQVAHYLMQRGIGREVQVGLCVDRSLEMVIGLLGILKAGGAYVPLDPSYPQERLAFMMADMQAPLLVTQRHLSEGLSASLNCVVCLDSDWEEISQESNDNLIRFAHSDAIAYVIYTSGSTGSPKGVLTEHHALTNQMLWMQTHWPLSSDDCVLQKTPFSFDVSLWEFFWALLAGARLIMARPGGHRDSAYLRNVIVDQGITTLHFVPSMLSIFLEEPNLKDCLSLQRVLCGGESLSVELQNRFFHRLGAELLHFYGPTEASITVTGWTCKRDEERSFVPLGSPVANTQIYLFDRDTHLVPVGVPGELYIGGVALARGYLNGPEQTAERFLPDPFSEKAGARLYRTGDLTRYRPDGMLEFIGRIDHQVKLRGYRIELGEIETVLKQYPCVQETVVVIREDQPEEKQLVAYVVARGDSPLPSDLCRHVKQTLPEYMVPAIFMMLDAFPLTKNGKVDRQSLPVPERNRTVPYQAPSTEIQGELTKIWEEVLGCKPIGIRDNFFESGGHSLRATQVLARVHKIFHVDLPLDCMFNFPTVVRLAEIVEGNLSKTPNASVHFLTKFPRNTNPQLSFSQERVWFVEQLHPGNLAYNFQATFQFKGALNIPVLERSLTEIIRRHEVWRTTFSDSEGKDGPVQIVHPPFPVKLPVMNLQEFPTREREEETQRLVNQEIRKPFNLAELPLIRWILLRVDSQNHILVHGEHHVVHDGLSFNVFLYELVELYKAFTADQTSPLHELAIQFGDFAQFQRQWMKGETAEGQLKYWQQKLAGSSQLLALPYDRPRQSVQTFSGATVRQKIPLDVSECLNEFGRQERVTTFMTLMTAFVILLARYTGQKDFCLGTVFANRRWRETEELLGMLINNVVFRADVSHDPTGRDLLNRIRTLTLEASANQDLPFDQVVEAVSPERNLSYNPLFQVMFGLHDAPSIKGGIPGLSIDLGLGLNNGSAKFDLSLLILPETSQYIRSDVDSLGLGYECVWEYNTDLFDEGTINRIARHYQAALKGLVTDLSQVIWELPLLSQEEQYQLVVKWNDTQTEYPHHQSIPQLFEQQVERSPDALALVFEDQQLTYQELNARANQLAYYLMQRGVGREVRVGLCVDRSLEMVIGLLGILKAGGAYVPLDPSYPQERLAFLLADTQAPVLITQQHLIEKLPASPDCVVGLDTDWERISHESPANLMRRAHPDAIAYVIYTSGSTGFPKGVLTTHQALTNQMLWRQMHWPLSSDDRVLQKTPFSFDVSLWEFFWPFLAGACLIMARPGGHRDSAYLREMIVDQGITTLHFVPSMLSVFLEEPELEACRSLRQVRCGGEILPVKLQQRFFEQMEAKLVHCYGPTEASIAATGWTCKRDESRSFVPLGPPVANTQIYVLDRHMHLVPVGVPGELYIGGVALARGYLNRPEQTAERFLPDPCSEKAGARLYRSGDHVRYRPDGMLEFIGRIDHQVKLRGNRIELEEIETVLRQYPGIQKTVMLMREDEPGEKQLVAYVVTERDTPLSSTMLRNFLHEKLPSYMVPATFMVLDEFPLTPNGKVDRRRLPVPEQVQHKDPGQFKEAHGPIEEILTGIWAEVLKRDRVGVDENFFELGGHSLKATQVMSRLRLTFPITISLQTLFEKPTVEQLAREIEHSLAQEIEGLPPEEVQRLLGTL